MAKNHANTMVFGIPAAKNDAKTMVVGIPAAKNHAKTMQRGFGHFCGCKALVAIRFFSHPKPGSAWLLHPSAASSADVENKHVASSAIRF